MIYCLSSPTLSSHFLSQVSFLIKKETLQRSTQRCAVCFHPPGDAVVSHTYWCPISILTEPSTSTLRTEAHWTHSTDGKRKKRRRKEERNINSGRGREWQIDVWQSEKEGIYKERKGKRDECGCLIWKQRIELTCHLSVCLSTCRHVFPRRE